MPTVGSGLRYQFIAQGLSDDSFSVLAFELKEGLSSPFSVELTLLSRLSDLSPAAVVDQCGVLSWYLNDELQRQVHGVVSRFSQEDAGHHHTQYRITLVPALSRLMLRQGCRIFQKQSVLSIIATLLSEMGINDYAFSCDSRFESAIREYCVQYRETDFDFLSRLAAEVGLFYYFEHSSHAHTLIFSDSTSKQSKLEVAFPYNAISGGSADMPFIRAFSYQHQIRPATVTLKDNSFKKPQYSFLQTSTGSHLDFQRADYEHYDYPGRYKDDETGRPITRVRQEYLRRDAQQATAKSNIMQAISGGVFTLNGHGDASLNCEWLIVSATHQGVQGAAAEEANTTTATTYHNTFTAILSNTPWQATPLPTPRVTGPQSAIVVGPPGEEIFCDEFGRVKVLFPWDRQGRTDDSASGWVRVSQGWAGGQYGMMALPRIGHEVIVSFFEGDPDQPIITGRTYHATNLPPYALPEHKTRTVLKTKTHKGEGGNELRFEDECDKQEIYLHAQKDMNTLVEHDHRQHIKHDAHLDIDNDRFSRIKTNDHLTVEGELRQCVKVDYSLVVEGSVYGKSGKAWVSEAGTEVHIKAGQKVVIEAGAEITLKAGGSFIKIDPAGVHLVGAAINLNSGGSAGSGSGFAGSAALLPSEVEAALISQRNEMVPLPEATAVTIMPAVFLMAEGTHATAVKGCPLIKDKA